MLAYRHFQLNFTCKVDSGAIFTLRLIKPCRKYLIKITHEYAPHQRLNSFLPPGLAAIPHAETYLGKHASGGVFKDWQHSHNTFY